MKILKTYRAKLILLRNAKHMRLMAIARLMLDTPLFETKTLAGEHEFSEEILERISCAFIAANVNNTKQADIWTELADENNTFMNAMQNKDSATLQQIFVNLYQGSLLVGMGHTSNFLGKKFHKYFSFRCRDSILSLAEALAIKGLTSNVQTPLAEYMRTTNGDLLPYIQKIEAVLGHSIQSPTIGKPPVAVIGDKLINPDFVRHAYVMYRVKQLGFSSNTKILEIGGGYGCVARFAYLQGFTDYTIVDLPYVNAIQAAFLSATIGESEVSCYGENDAAIKIRPCTQKDSLEEKYDLVINMDSLPEINLEEALAYLNKIKSSAKFFLSINQEAKKLHRENISQHSVQELIEMVGGFKRIYRYPYWMEQGYAEELYEVVV